MTSQEALRAAKAESSHRMGLIKELQEKVAAENSAATLKQACCLPSACVRLSGGVCTCAGMEAAELQVASL